MSFAEDWEKFPKRLAPFQEYSPTLRATIDKTFYAQLTKPDKQAIIIAALGHQCACGFDEICFICTHGYGLAGTKLLRGLYERAVASAFFAKNEDAATKFMQSFDVDFARLLHRNQEFLKANGEDPAKILPEKLLQKVEGDFKIAKEKEERCEACGAPRGRVDVVTMARMALPELVPILGLAYLEPTLHVHCTWYSVLDSIDTIQNEEHQLEFQPRIEADRAMRTLQLAHDVILHTLKTHDAYFGLNLETEIEQRRREYHELWKTIAAI